MDLAGADRHMLLNELKGKLSDACVDFSDTQSDEFFESIALCDDNLLEKFESNQIQPSDISQAIRTRSLFPCFFGSAL